jgi:hypothetical protein
MGSSGLLLRLVLFANPDAVGEGRFIQRWGFQPELDEHRDRCELVGSRIERSRG